MKRFLRVVLVGMFLIIIAYLARTLGPRHGYFSPFYTDAYYAAQQFLQQAADAKLRQQGQESIVLQFQGSATITHDMIIPTDWDVQGRATLGSTQLTYRVKERWEAGHGFRVKAVEVWRQKR